MEKIKKENKICGKIKNKILRTKVREKKGITLMVLVITIIVLLIIAGISITYGDRTIKQAKLENLKTNMLLIEADAKANVEEANFYLGTKFDNASEEEKSNRIMTAKEHLKGNVITDVTSDNIETTIEKDQEGMLEDNNNLIFYYKLDTEKLEEIGLNGIKDSEGIYIVKYDIKNSTIEIYNTVGFQNKDNEIKYSLTDIKNLEI